MSELCTKERPMPANQDQIGQNWVHDNCKMLSFINYVAHFKCMNCGYEFRSSYNTSKKRGINANGARGKTKA
jgi:hypothetical protein